MDSDMIHDWKRAGTIAAEALRHGSRLMKPETPVMEVLDAIEDYIAKQGGGIAFPAQSSLNQVAAHACPDTAEQRYLTGDIAKLDVGVHVNGFVADNAMTVGIGTTEHQPLIRASRAALNAAIKELRPGVNTAHIGGVIQRTITEHGFKPIVNLSGHGIGQWVVHKAPSFPNYAAPSGVNLKEGMAFAMEPFATTGSGTVADSSPATVFMHVARKPVRSIYARAILQTINTYQGLPFTSRWLDRIHGTPKTRLALSELQRAGIIHAYPPLVDTGNGLVSQAEHCFILLEKPIVLTQLDDWPPAL